MKKEKISFHGAARLREERERIGLSQLDSESRFGISRVTWGKYERGESTPGADVLTALAELGADVLYIITGERMPTGSSQRHVANTHAARAAEVIRDLTLTESDADIVVQISRRFCDS